MSDGVPNGWVNLNTCSKQELVDLPAIGDRKADDIIAGRPYTRRQELTAKEVLTSATYERIRDRVYVNKESFIDLNLASLEDIQSLPGVGEKKAEKIIAYRIERKAKKKKAYRSASDLTKVLSESLALKIATILEYEGTLTLSFSDILQSKECTLQDEQTVPNPPFPHRVSRKKSSSSVADAAEEEEQERKHQKKRAKDSSETDGHKHHPHRKHKHHHHKKSTHSDPGDHGKSDSASDTAIKKKKKKKKIASSDSLNRLATEPTKPTTKRRKSSTPTLNTREVPAHCKVASWNLKNFTRNTDLRLFSRVAILISTYHIIALQEIKSVEVLEMLLENHPEDLQHYSFIASPGVGKGRHKEHYAFLWDTRFVQMTKSFMYSDSDDLFVRPPFVAAFECGAFQCALINIHVVYGASADRVLEIQNLPIAVRDVNRRLRSVKHVLLLGDFNLSPHHEAWGPMLDIDYTHMLTGQSESTTLAIRDQGNMYDNIWYCPRKTGLAWTGNVKISDTFTFFNISSENGHDVQALRNTVSDHKPIWTEFRTS